jgi:hypothetical protein
MLAILHLLVMFVAVSAMLDLARLQNHAIEKRPIDLAVVGRPRVSR